MYPFGDLPGNLASFARALRRQHRFRCGPGELVDAARALEVVDIHDERAVRDALRPIFCATHADAEVFDEAFTRFFFPGPPGVPQPDRKDVPRRERERGETGEDRRAQRKPAGSDTGEPPEEDGARAGGEVEPSMPEAAEDTAEQTLRMARASYSPLRALGRTGIEVAPPGADWHEAARALVRRIELGLSRRWVPAPTGRRFDLRRTLRASLHTGGEPIGPRWRRRARRTPRFVVLVDGSRSMSDAAATAMTLAAALASVTPRVEVFTFSTELQRVTPFVRRAAGGAPVRIDAGRESWGGGTSIGACLRACLRSPEGHRIARDTVVVIASDGLDVGEPELLRSAMHDLRSRAAGIVWLNPLLDTPGYEPTSRGMRTARPFISTFASVKDAAGLARLGRRVRLRRT
jgi:uncharacterized protein with von Willebrand factor type A (vWA) domain